MSGDSHQAGEDVRAGSERIVPHVHAPQAVAAALVERAVGAVCGDPEVEVGKWYGGRSAPALAGCAVGRRSGHRFVHVASRSAGDVAFENRDALVCPVDGVDVAGQGALLDRSTPGATPPVPTLGKSSGSVTASSRSRLICSRGEPSMTPPTTRCVAAARRLNPARTPQVDGRCGAPVAAVCVPAVAVCAPASVDEHEGEVAVRALVRADDLDLPAGVAYRGVDVDAAALHRRPCLLRRRAVLPLVQALQMSQGRRPSSTSCGSRRGRARAQGRERRR